MLVVMDIDGGAGTGIDEGHRHQHRQLSERDGGTSLSITDSALRSRSQRVEGGGDEKEEERRSKVTGQKFGEEGRGGEEEGRGGGGRSVALLLLLHAVRRESGEGGHGGRRGDNVQRGPR